MARKKNTIRSISPERAECTDYSHSWVPYDGGRRGSGWFRVLRCQRCKVKRHQTIERDGSLKPNSTRYDYSEAPGYLMKGGRLTDAEKNVIRLQDLEDLFSKKGTD